ncbi:MAG: hypothetical protein ABIQ99_06015 [Thermoflexales bacterium]
MNLGWQRARRMLKEWAILAGLMVLLHALLFLAWAALNPGRSTPITVIVALMLAYVIGLAAIIIVFSRRVRRADSPPEFQVARERGVAAIAQVLEIAPTGWRSKQGSSVSFTWRPIRREYQIRLNVMPSGGDAYEVTIAEYLTSDHVPAAGVLIPIRIHPQRPDIIVLARDAAAPLVSP